MFDTADLSRFTSLKHLSLTLDFDSFDVSDRNPTSIAPLVSLLSTVATYQLEQLNLYHDDTVTYSLDSILVALNGLKDIDAILSHPKFRHLRRIQFHFRFFVTIQAHFIASNILPPTSSILWILASDPGSFPGLDDNGSTDHPRDTLKRRAEDIVRRKIEEELKWLNSRGILNLRLSVQLREESILNTAERPYMSLVLGGKSKMNLNSK